MLPRDYARLVNDMKLFGFIDPLTVRPGKTAPWEIIDGENRWRAAKDLGIDCPFMSILVDDATAQKLTVALNELRGQYDPKDMGKLLNTLLATDTPETLLEQLPFTEESLAGLVGLKDFDWKGMDKKEAPQREDAAPKWVERTFRLPPDASEVLDEALAKAKGSDEISDAQAIEMIAADFLAAP
jgi:ParB-like chromosome segregation protein Spo0J